MITDDFKDDRLRTPTPPPYTKQNPHMHGKWWQTYKQALVDEGLSLSYPSDTVARAYAGVAGMLNLMCIFDAVMLATMGSAGEPARK